MHLTVTPAFVLKEEHVCKIQFKNYKKSALVFQ